MALGGIFAVLDRRYRLAMRESTVRSRSAPATGST